MKDSIRTYCHHRLEEADRISDARKETLNKLIAYLRYKEDLPSHLLFIDTDNSRTSHFLKVWTMVAAHYFEQKHIDAFCIGESHSAVNSNVVKTLLDIGFDVLVVGSENNPTYAFRFGEEIPPTMCVSKEFTDVIHWPKHMTCIRVENEEWSGKLDNELDLYLPYNNPAYSDETSEQDECYYQLCNKIAREILFVFKEVYLS